MRKYNVFISSVQKEFENERKEIKDFILNDFLLKEYFNVFLFEDLPAKNKPVEQAYLPQAASCDAYVALIGKEYAGSRAIKVSPVEKEFSAARKNGRYICVFIKGAADKDGARDKKTRALIKEISKHCCYKRFGNIHDLKSGVYESLIAFLKEKGEINADDFDKRINKEASFSDISAKKVKWFLGIAKTKRNLPFDSGTSVRNAFHHLGLVKGGNITNAALLLFGKNQNRFFGTAKIKCLWFGGLEIEKPFRSYQIYDGNLFDQVDSAVKFVLDAVELPVVQQRNTAQVKREPEIPVFAIQEAIVNAVAHRDYNSKASVQVMIFADRVEIWNPSDFPDKLKVSDLKKPHASHPINTLIASTMYLADYIQQAGSGTIEMLKRCKERGLPQPEFRLESRHEFKTVIKRNPGRLNRSAAVEAKNAGNINERQKKAVEYAAMRGKITNSEYQKINKATRITATRDLSDLVKKKIFKQSGTSGRGSVYILVDIIAS